MRVIVAERWNHGRADFQPHAGAAIIAKAAGPMAADLSDLPWKKLLPAIRRRP